jgi:DNA-binding LacI/PurR family transcriptional regulator
MCFKIRRRRGTPSSSAATMKSSSRSDKNLPRTALRERGLRVPEDISIVGFDDIPEAAHFVPGLTTVRQDFGLVGRLAVEFIISLIENPETPIHQRVLQPKLIVRNSTRPL